MILGWNNPLAVFRPQRFLWQQHRQHMALRHHRHHSPSSMTGYSTSRHPGHHTSARTSRQDHSPLSTARPVEVAVDSRQMASIRETCMPSWSQARFSVSLAPMRHPSDCSGPITHAIANTLAPLLSGVTTGVGLLMVLNSSARLAISNVEPSSKTCVHAAAGAAESRPRREKSTSSLLNSGNTSNFKGGEEMHACVRHQGTAVWQAEDPARAVHGGVSSSSVALSIRDGCATWPAEYDLWLTLDTETASSQDFPPDLVDETRRDGIRFRGVTEPVRGERQPRSRPDSLELDFLVIWSSSTTATESGEGSTGMLDSEDRRRFPVSSICSDDISCDDLHGCSDEVAERFALVTDNNGAEAGEAGEDGGQSSSMASSSRAMGLPGGHTSRELRPWNEFSVQRQAALDEALVTVGVDVKELTEAGEFLGTAAFKCYNTFVRPRPKQLTKAMQESVPRAALRTAHQVAFLVRRHNADRAEYLRNKDTNMTAIARRGLTPNPVVLVCDNIRSAYNVGSIFRSADTARAAEVVTCGFTPHPGGHGEDKLRKTAFGSLDVVPHRHFEDAVKAILSLKRAGALVCALETTEGASSIFDFKFPLPPPPEGQHNANIVDNDLTYGKQAVIYDADDNLVKGDTLRSETGHEQQRHKNSTSTCGSESGDRQSVSGNGGRGKAVGGRASGRPVVALVLGNEVTGVDERVLHLCDVVLEVPVFGLKNSLNVASAGTVVLYEVLRQWALADCLAGGERNGS